jgi:hypothetical protein
MKKLLAALAVFGSLGFMASTAYAGPCPVVGGATDCNFVITITDSGITTTVNGAIPPYDGVEDQLVGVINNSTHSVAQLSLTGSGLFGFDGDGLCTFIDCSAWAHPTGYEGPNTSFSFSNINSGLVLFTGGLAAGATAYFSLEEPASINTVVTAPEPGTLALLGLAAAAFGFSRRRNS